MNIGTKVYKLFLEISVEENPDELDGILLEYVTILQQRTHRRNMEVRQLKIIRENLPILVELTTVNTGLLAILRSRSVLSSADVGHLNSRPSQMEKSYLLYEILQTRVRGYEVLLEALSETKQTLAIRILSEWKVVQSELAPTKLFCKPLVNLDATMERASVIFITTVDSLLTMSKLEETLSGKHFYSQDKEIKSWDDIKDKLQRESFVGRYAPTKIWAFRLHRTFDLSTKMLNALLERAKTMKFLLVSENDPPKFDGINQADALPDTFTWDQLNKSTKMKVLSQNILDQGKPRKLSEFCKSYLYENVDFFYSELLQGKLLAALLKEEVPVLFRSTIPPIKHYVPRCLRSRYHISLNVFHTNTDHEVFAFSGNNLDIDKLRELGSGSTGRIDTAANQFDLVRITADYILLQFKTDFRKLCKKLEGMKTIHRLKIIKEKLVWQETVGEKMTCLQKNVLEENAQVRIREEEFFDVVNDIYDNRPRVLCDSAGMGKSVLLAKLAQETKNRHPEKSIVVFFVMTDFIVSVQNEIKKIEHPENSMRTNLISIIQREIAAYSSMYGMPESIFQDHSLSLYLFFDGLDEIPTDAIPLSFSSFEVIRTFYQNACIFVSTRPELLHQIESALSSLALTIDPFNDNNQIEFLTAHWSYDRVIQKLSVNRNMLREFAINSLATLRSGISDVDKDIAGVPLQCLLIAEVLKMEAKEFADPANTMVSKNAKPSLKITSISQLYDLVYERKFEAFKIRYLEKDNRPLKPQCLETVHLQIGIETIFPEVKWRNTLRPKLFTTKVYTDLKTMIPQWESTFSQFQNGDLPRKDILRVGIVESVEDGKWQFLHRTFGEYLVAKFAAHQILQSNICDQDLLDFVHNNVLKVDIDNVPCKLIQQSNRNFVSRKFKYPVICHFINSWLHQNSNTSRHFLEKGPQSCWELVVACIRHNYPNLLEIFSNILNSESVFGTNILYLAACCSTEATFEKLRGGKPWLSISNPSLLHVAVEVGNVNLVPYLLSTCGFRKAIEDSSLRPINDLIPYCVANTINAIPNMVQNRIKILHSLLKCKGIDLSLRDRDDKLPISLPNIHGRLLCEMVQRMSPAELRNEKDEDDRNILHLHAYDLKQEHYNMFLRSLKTTHPDAASSLVKYRDWFGQTPLHYLVSKMDPTPETIELFNELNSDFSSTDFTGYNIQWTALHYGRNYKIIANILKQPNKESPNFNTNSFLRTNLHIAARHIRNPDVLEILISQGYNINQPDYFGNTPLFYALRNPDHEVSKRCIEILHDHLANLHQRNLKGESLFHVAAQYGNVMAMELLFQIGYFGGDKLQSNQIYSTSSVVDKKGNTPLHHALTCSKRTTISTVQFLVSRFLSDVNHLNKNGHCPLQHGLKQKQNNVNFDVLEYMERLITRWPQELIENSLQAIHSVNNAGISDSDRYRDLTQRILGKGSGWMKAWRYISGSNETLFVIAVILVAAIIALIKI